MVFWMLLVILTCILYKVNGQTQIIDPTTSNSTGSFYVASDYNNSAQYYHGGSLTCNATYCHIVCDVSSGCTSLKIYASSVTTLVIQCLQSSSCQNLRVYLVSNVSDLNVEITCVNPSVSTSNSGACQNAIFNMYGYNNNGVKTNNMSFVCGSYSCYGTEMNGLDFHRFDIDCNAPNSCERATITGVASNQLNLHCDNQRSCSPYVTVYCPYHQEDACNIDCAAYTESCKSMVMYVPSNYIYNYLDITCPSRVKYPATFKPCSEMYISCTETYSPKSNVLLSWDYSDNEWNCGAYTGPSYCCPYLMNKAPTTKEPTKAYISAEPTIQPSIAPVIPTTANLETTADDDDEETNIQGELKNDDNNSDTIIIIIVVFSSLFFLLLVIIIIVMIFYLKILNNKINIVHQNSVGIELIERNTNQNKIDGNKYNANKDNVIDHKMHNYHQQDVVQEGIDNDVVEQINQTVMEHNNDLL